VTADHQKVVHPQEDLKVDLPEDQKADLQEAVILTDLAMTQEPHVDLEHLEQNQAIVFQENANHSIAIIAKVENVVHSETASHLMANVSRIKEEIVNHSIATTVKVVSAVHSEIANHIKVANASLLAELKIQHVHLIKAIIAGIAMQPQK
jgi:hypothetical protein